MLVKISVVVLHPLLLVANCNGWVLHASSSSGNSRTAIAAPFIVSIRDDGRKRGFVAQRPSSRSALMRLSAAAAAAAAESTAPDSSNKIGDPSAEDVPLRTLYNASKPYRNGTVQVDSIHTLYYELYGRSDEDGNETRMPAATSRIPTALFLHGGPGAGCFPNHARFFDPEVYRIVLVDQRGCGRSTPNGEIRNNTLHHLVDDLEILKDELRLSAYDIVFGGSWGTTLALAYAQRYPSSVGSLLLRGVCTFRQCEIDWLFAANGGIAQRNPAAWRRFQNAVNVTDAESSQNPRLVLETYADIFTGNNHKVGDGIDANETMMIARNWSGYEMLASMSHTLEKEDGRIPTAIKESTNFSEIMNISRRYDSTDGGFVAVHDASSTEWRLENPKDGSIVLEEGVQVSTSVDGLRQGIIEKNIAAAEETTSHVIDGRRFGADCGNDADLPSAQESQTKIPAQNKLTCHYSTNISHVMSGVPNILDHVDRIRHIPCVAIQGGSDRITPIDTALALKAAWPEMELRVPTKAGHSMYDAAITHEIITATDRFIGQ